MTGNSRNTRPFPHRGRRRRNRGGRNVSSSPADQNYDNAVTLSGAQWQQPQQQPQPQVVMPQLPGFLNGHVQNMTINIVTPDAMSRMVPQWVMPPGYVDSVESIQNLNMNMHPPQAMSQSSQGYGQPMLPQSLGSGRPTMAQPVQRRASGGFGQPMAPPQQVYNQEMPPPPAAPVRGRGRRAPQSRRGFAETINSPEADLQNQTYHTNDTGRNRPKQPPKRPRAEDEHTRECLSDHVSVGLDESASRTRPSKRQRRGTIQPTQKSTSNRRKTECANCGDPGHELKHCPRWNTEDGYLYGCPLHNNTGHPFHECRSYKRLSTEEKFSFLYTDRMGLCQIWNPDVSWLTLWSAAGHPDLPGPLSPGFVRRLAKGENPGSEELPLQLRTGRVQCTSYENSWLVVPLERIKLVVLDPLTRNLTGNTIVPGIVPSSQLRPAIMSPTPYWSRPLSDRLRPRSPKQSPAEDVSAIREPSLINDERLQPDWTAIMKAKRETSEEDKRRRR